MNTEDWIASEGNPCPKCGQPDVRFIKGMCRQCYHAKVEKITKAEASLNPLLHVKDKKLASRVARYLAKLDRKI